MIYLEMEGKKEWYEAFLEWFLTEDKRKYRNGKKVMHESKGEQKMMWIRITEKNQI